MDFCTRAKNTGASTSVNEPDGGIAYKSCTAYVVESKVTEVNGQMLKSTAPSFSGAALSILRIDEVTEFNATNLCINLLIVINNNSILQSNVLKAWRTPLR